MKMVTLNLLVPTNFKTVPPGMELGAQLRAAQRFVSSIRNMGVFLCYMNTMNYLHLAYFDLKKYTYQAKKTVF